MNALLEPLIDSPSLPAYLEELQAILESEREKREKFYQEIRTDEKKEFINGEVIASSPATLKHNRVAKWTGYVLEAMIQRYAKGAEILGEKILIALTRNDYEPDLLIFSPDKIKQFTDDQWKFPAPDFAVEILSKSTKDRDRGVKFTDYAAHNVKEYWIIDPWVDTLEQYFVNASREYELHVKVDSSGSVKSPFFGDVVIPAAALFDDERCDEFCDSIRADQ